jgi:hypothetical protein
VQKSDPQFRPKCHHLEERVQPHILSSFPAYALWETLEQWMTRAGLGHAPGPVLAELARLKVVDVFLHGKDLHRPPAAGTEQRIHLIDLADQARPGAA